MNAPDIVRRVVESLEAINLPYMLVGSFSSNVYSIPRSTRDADFVVNPASGQLHELATHLGPDFSFDFQIQFETVTGTRKNIAHVVGSEFEIELFRLSTDAHDQERFQRRVRRQTHGFSVWVPTVEDVVVTKLRWVVGALRNKDRDDIREVLTVQEGQLDWMYVHRWAAEHGTRACLDDIIHSIPADLLAPGSYPVSE